MNCLSQYNQSKILFQATADGQLDIMKLAIEAKANPHLVFDFSKLYITRLPNCIAFVDGRMYTNLLHIAVLSDSPSILDYVIKDLGADYLSISDRSGFTPIAIAARNNKPNAVKHLIEQYDVDPKQRIEAAHWMGGGYTTKMFSLTSLALYGNNEELASYLFTLDPEAVCDVALTYLILGQIEQFQSLVQSHDELIQQFNDSPKVSFMAAIQSGSIEMVKFMVLHLDLSELTEHDKEFILLDSVVSSHFDMVRYLILDLNYTINSFSQLGSHKTLGKQIVISCDIYDFLLQHCFQQYLLSLNFLYLARYTQLSLNFIQHIVQHHQHHQPDTTSFSYLLGICLSSGQCTIEMIDYAKQFSDRFGRPVSSAINGGCSLDIIQHLVRCCDITIDNSFVQSILPVLIETPGVSVDVLKYLFNPELVNDVDIKIDSIVQKSINYCNLTFLQYLDEHFTIQFQSQHLVLASDRESTTEELISFLLSKISPLEVDDKIEFLSTIIQHPKVGVETIFNIINQLEINIDEVRTSNGETLFQLIASTTKSIVMFDLLMNFSQDKNILNIPDVSGFPLLFNLLPRFRPYASYELLDQSNAQLFTFIIKQYHRQIDLNFIPDRSGFTLCHHATKFKCTSIMSLLIQHKADIEKKSTSDYDEKYPPLHFALLGEPQLKMVKLLLQHTNDIGSNVYGRIPIAIFNQSGDDWNDVQIFVLNHLSSITSRNVLLYQVVNYVSDENRLKLCQYLIQQKAIATHNIDQGSILNVAIEKGGGHELVTLLINSKAPINTPNTAGQTPLAIAIEKRAFDVVKLLVEAGAQVNGFCITNKQGFHQTPLTAIIYTKFDNEDETNGEEQRMDLVSLLINHNANINGTNVNQETPIVAALKTRQFGIVLYLFGTQSQMIDYTILNSVGQTILHSAITQPHDAILRCIIHFNDIGFNLCNQQDYYGKTPLVMAAQYGWVDNIWFLLDHGADPTICDFNGRILLHHLVSFEPRQSEFEGTEEEKLANDEDFRSDLLENAIDACVEYYIFEFTGECICFDSESWEDEDVE